MLCYGDAITSSSVLNLLLNVLPCIRQIIELCLIENSCKSFRSYPYGLYHLFMILMMSPSQSLTSFEVLYLTPFFTFLSLISAGYENCMRTISQLSEYVYLDIWDSPRGYNISKDLGLNHAKPNLKIVTSLYLSFLVVIQLLPVLFPAFH